MTDAAPRAETRIRAIPAIALETDTVEAPRELALHLAHHLSPRIFLHPLTADYPISIDDYLAACRVPSFNGDLALEPDLQRLASSQQMHLLPVVVHTFSRVIVGMKPGLVPLNGWTLTFFVMLYANQPDARMCGCYPLPGSGHAADIEWVVVLSRPAPERPPAAEAAFYSAHGSRESQWVVDPSSRGQQMPLPVFVARDTHANYPTGGAKVRIWGFHVDWCGDGDDRTTVARAGEEDQGSAARAVSPIGNTLQPGRYTLQFLSANHSWRLFTGAMGPDGIGGLGGRGRLDIPGTETNGSGDAWRRRLFRLS